MRPYPRFSDYWQIRRIERSMRRDTPVLHRWVVRIMGGVVFLIVSGYVAIGLILLVGILLERYGFIS